MKAHSLHDSRENGGRGASLTTKRSASPPTTVGRSSLRFRGCVRGSWRPRSVGVRRPVRRGRSAAGLGDAELGRPGGSCRRGRLAGERTLGRVRGKIEGVKTRTLGAEELDDALRCFNLLQEELGLPPGTGPRYGGLLEVSCGASRPDDRRWTAGIATGDGRSAEPTAGKPADRGGPDRRADRAIRRPVAGIVVGQPTWATASTSGLPDPFDRSLVLSPLIAPPSGPGQLNR